MLIELRSVTRTYHMGNVEVHALRGVDLDIDANEYAAIMGPSGSGKSTLMNILGCLDRPTTGHYFLGGSDVARMSDDQLSRVRNRSIGFVFQSFNLIAQLTVLENVEVPLFYKQVPRRDRIALCLDLIERVGLSHRLSHLPAQLSGGEQQRVSIARALVNEPIVILADEPTGNLDSTMAAQIMELLEEINIRGTTIVMVTHDPDLSARAHRRVHIHDGRITDPQPELTTEGA